MQTRAVIADADPKQWDGVSFRCFRCSGEFRLEAKFDSVRTLRAPVERFRLIWIETPECPTPECGELNIVAIPLEESGARTIGGEILLGFTLDEKGEE